jgi:hypothetical protein
VIFEVPNAVCALCEEQIEISCHMFERCISPFIYYMVFLSITCVTDAPNLSHPFSMIRAYSSSGKIQKGLSFI